MSERISSCCSAPLIHDERGDGVAMCRRCREHCEVIEIKKRLPPLWVDYDIAAPPSMRVFDAWRTMPDTVTSELYVPADAIREIIAKSRSVGVGLLGWATALAEIENYLKEAEKC